MKTSGIFKLLYYPIKFEKYGEPLYIIPFGDIHRHTKLCHVEKWREFLEWAKSKERTYFLGMGDYCLPLDTEVLTLRGFKTYDQLHQGEVVLGYNKVTGHTEWTNLSGVYLSHNQPLIRLSSKSFDFRCTPNHEWFTSQQTWKVSGARKRRTNDEPRKVRAQHLKTQHRIISFARCSSGGKINITPLEAHLLGWIVTDGHSRKNKLAVSISQSEKKYAGYLLDKFPGWFSGIYKKTDTDRTFNIKTAKIRELFERIGYKTKNDLPLLVLDMPSDCWQAMLLAFNMAEGWKQNNAWCFAQLPGPVLEAYQLLCILTGTKISKSLTNKTGVVTYKQNKRQYTDVANLHVCEVGLADVFCPQTLLGSIVIRQNNQITITGNCDFISKSERKAISAADLHDSTVDTLDDLYKNLTDELADELSFMKGRLIGLLEGNHYAELQSGITTTQYLCEKLGCAYLGVSAFIRLGLSQNSKHKSRQAVDIWAHHGKGASRMVGGSLNRVENWAEAAECDICLMGHDHKKSVGYLSRLYIKAAYDGEITLGQRKVLLARTGGFLRAYVDGTKSYLAEGAYNPSDLGTIKIELTPKREVAGGTDTMEVDIHASI